MPSEWLHFVCICLLSGEIYILLKPPKSKFIFSTSFGSRYHRWHKTTQKWHSRKERASWSLCLINVDAPFDVGPRSHLRKSPSFILLIPQVFGELIHNTLTHKRLENKGEWLEWGLSFFLAAEVYTGSSSFLPGTSVLDKWNLWLGTRHWGKFSTLETWKAHTSFPLMRVLNTC